MCIWPFVLLTPSFSMDQLCNYVYVCLCNPTYIVYLNDLANRLSCFLSFNPLKDQNRKWKYHCLPRYFLYRPKRRILVTTKILIFNKNRHKKQRYMMRSGQPFCGWRRHGFWWWTKKLPPSVLSIPLRYGHRNG